MRKSQCILVFLSRGYFKSKACLTEIRASLEMNKPLIAVHERESTRGGASLTELWAEAATNQLEFECLEHEVIPWHRVADYQLLSLELIAERLVASMPNYIGVRLPPRLFLRDEVRLQTLLLPKAVVLYASPDNQGAQEFGNELRARYGFADLRITNHAGSLRTFLDLSRTPLRIAMWKAKAHRKNDRYSATDAALAAPGATSSSGATDTSQYTSPSDVAMAANNTAPNPPQTVEAPAGSPVGTSQGSHEHSTQSVQSTWLAQAEPRALSTGSLTSACSTGGLQVVTEEDSCRHTRLSNEASRESGQTRVSGQGRVSVRNVSLFGALRCSPAISQQPTCMEAVAEPTEPAHEPTIVETGACLVKAASTFSHHVAQTASTFSERMSSDSRRRRMQPTQMLLYLNRHTFAEGRAGERLASDLRAAIAQKMPIVLVHESMPEHGGCEFAQFFESTPQVWAPRTQRTGVQRSHCTSPSAYAPCCFLGPSRQDLINAGLYRTIANAAHAPPHREVSLALVLKSMGAKKSDSDGLCSALQHPLSRFRRILFRAWRCQLQRNATPRA